MTSEELIKQCEALGMDNVRIQQVQEGLDFGLSVDEVSIYAKLDFDVYQMNSIRLAIKNRLTKEELNFVADKKFSGHQMEQLVTGLKEGLTLDKVKEEYANESLSAHDMCKRRLELIKDLTIEAPNLFDKQYYDEMLRLADKQSRQMELMNQNFQVMQQFLKTQDLENDKKEDEQAKKIKEQEQRIVEQEQKIAAQAKDIETQIKRATEIASEVKNLNLVLKEKDKFIENLVEQRQRRKSVSLFSFLKEKSERPITVMELMGNAKFDEEQLTQIRLGYENGLTVEDIRWYAKPKFDAKRMECMRLVIENGRKRKES